MSKRLQILQQSLAKKEAEFDRRLQAHFDDVKSANGQPLNDKRGGHAVMLRWEKQNDALRNLQASINKTKQAIEREESKIANVENVKDDLPQIIKDLIDDGTITQWRKYPNRFFVNGITKARIVYDMKKKKLFCSHVQAMTTVEETLKFREVFFKIQNALEAA